MNISVNGIDDNRELTAADADADNGVIEPAGLFSLFRFSITAATNPVIKILMDRDGMTKEEAIKFFEIFIEGAWVGDATPVWSYPISGDDLQVH